MDTVLLDVFDDDDDDDDKGGIGDGRWCGGRAKSLPVSLLLM
jgi:hypothetical protein